MLRAILTELGDNPGRHRPTTNWSHRSTHLAAKINRDATSPRHRLGAEPFLQGPRQIRCLSNLRPTAEAVQIVLIGQLGTEDHARPGPAAQLRQRILVNSSSPLALPTPSTISSTG